ncbi:MAG TPA: site-2 protease family protein [Candidatus Dormibacteraeota bacterium]
MQNPNHISPDGKWLWNGTQWVPNYQSTADIPPQSPYHSSPAPSRRASGGIGAGIVAALAAAWAYGKYVFLVLLKFPAAATLLTGLLSFGVYALVYPWQVAIGIILLIFVHEMGHVVEIRRQGIHATAPIFIPIFGAAIFQRSHASTPMKQAQIGIAGPIAGTLGAIVSVVLFAATNNHIYLFWAYFGFLINLFNLIPFGMLDGGWILAPVSKWIQLGGLALLVVLFFIGVVNPLAILIVALGIPSVYRRFKDRAYDAYLTQGPLSPRAAMGAAWLALVVILGIGLFQTEQLAVTFVR